MLFGIPGGVPSAMLLGMLLTYGIQPGPSIVTEHLDLMYLIVWSFAIASVLGAILCFGATPMLAKLTKVPFSVLGAGLLVIMFLGAYQEGGQLGDLWVMLILGVVGWIMKESGVPRAPFLIGFVLAIPMERYYYLTDSLYEGVELDDPARRHRLPGDLDRSDPVAGVQVHPEPQHHQPRRRRTPPRGGRRPTRTRRCPSGTPSGPSVPRSASSPCSSWPRSPAPSSRPKRD